MVTVIIGCWCLSQNGSTPLLFQVILNLLGSTGDEDDVSLSLESTHSAQALLSIFVDCASPSRVTHRNTVSKAAGVDPFKNEPLRPSTVNLGR